MDEQGTPDAEPVRRGHRAINVEEWAKIMTRLYRIIDKELSSIEVKQSKASKPGAPDLTDADTRRLLTAVRAVDRIHVVNKDVADGEAAERVKEALRETQEARTELDRRLTRIFGPEEA